MDSSSYLNVYIYSWYVVEYQDCNFIAHINHKFLKFSVSISILVPYWCNLKIISNISSLSTIQIEL